MRPTAIVLASLPFAIAFAVGCGGKQLGGTPDGGNGGDDGGSYTEPDGNTCINIDLSTYDRSCDVDSDCVEISSGQICSVGCECGGSYINRSGNARYQAAIESIPVSASVCACPEFGSPTCVHHVCQGCLPDGAGGVTCIGVDAGAGEGGQGDAGVDSAEASTGEAGTCVDVSLSSFDTSCTADTDCMDVTIGNLCTGSCDCGGAAINKDGAKKYDTLTSGVMFGDCPCAFPGNPTCVHGACTLCGPGSLADAGCGDGG